VSTMVRVGVTGHSNLTDATACLVHESLHVRLALIADSGLRGVTCLARGADQVFADVVLALGGQLEVVAPSIDYFDIITDTTARARCAAYLERAAEIHTLPYPTAGHAAYLAASQHLVRTCDVLIAIWDGTASSGTGETVAYAERYGRATEVVWPGGAQRTAR
jgi:hypothetical protein